MTSPFRYGPLSAHTAHVCVDMQNLFRHGPWTMPWFERVLPVVQSLVRAHPAQTIFTRFIPPTRPEELPGVWQAYYRRWREFTLEHLDPAQLALARELVECAPDAPVVDKHFYSPFHRTDLGALLAARGVTTLVFSGTETDICVLAAVMDAVDLGYRVVIARDAVCSVSDSTHDALMALYHQRFSIQIEVAATAEILDNWPPRT